MAVDVTKTDEYSDANVPDADIETCLKVIRTVRGFCLGPAFDAEGAAILSHAHAKIIDLVEQCCEDGEEASRAGP